MSIFSANVERGPRFYHSSGSVFGAILIVILAGDLMQLPAMEGANRKVSVLADLRKYADAPTKGEHRGHLVKKTLLRLKKGRSDG